MEITMTKKEVISMLAEAIGNCYELPEVKKYCLQRLKEEPYITESELILEVRGFCSGYQVGYQANRTQFQHNEN